ncbi:MAG: ubiquitin-like domain-containing protein [Tepidiformaceae bacterium]
MIVLLAVFGFRLFPTHNVTVLNDGQALQVQSTFDPRGEALAAAGVALDPGDRVLHAEGSTYSSIAVERARPVSLEVDGTLAQFRTRAATIGGALAAAGISLQAGDRVYLDGRLATPRGSLAASGAFAARPGAAALYLPARDAAARIAVVRAKPVTVVVQSLAVETASSALTVQDLLADLGMTVREGDLVRPALATPLTAGMTVRLAKGRTVSLRIDGKDQSLYTLAQTVDDVLRILALDPGPGELVAPPRGTLITDGMTLVIGLTRFVEEDVTEPVAPPVVFETDPTMPAGSVRIVPGRDGARLTRYVVKFENGVAVERTASAGGGIIAEPVPTRHIIGSKGSVPKPVLTSPGFSGPYRSTMTVRATWYNALGGGRYPGDPNYGRTATGIMLDYGICAVDPSVIALGTRFYVPGYGVCLAADTGGAIRGNIIDLGFPDSAGDPGWGSQIVDIYILD